MRRGDVDVAVLGAGPAGAVAAAMLAGQRLSVALIDPGSAPDPRIESLPAPGLALAEELGLGAAVRSACLGHAARTRLRWREVPELREHGRAGPLLLDRAALHGALRAAARDAGAHWRAGRGRVLDVVDQGTVVVVGAGRMTARVVVDARGRAGLPRPAQGPGPRIVALPVSGRHGVVPGAAQMELEAFEDAWAWTCTLPDGRARGALFLAAEALAGRDAAARLDIARMCLGWVEAAGRPVAAGLRAAPDAVGPGNIIRIGDAALARDPIASHGLVHAFRSAVHAAAAAATLVDPKGQSDAARAFVTDRHMRAVAAARAATARAYADQTRHAGAFWAAQRTKAPPEERPVRGPALNRPLALSAPLVRVATLRGCRIVWTEGLWLDRAGEAAPAVGPFTARSLAEVLHPPASLPVLAARLDRAAPGGRGLAVLRALLDQGALVNAGLQAAPASPRRD